jgi:hypothetical protein
VELRYPILGDISLVVENEPQPRARQIECRNGRENVRSKEREEKYLAMEYENNDDGSSVAEIRQILRRKNGSRVGSTLTVSRPPTNHSVKIDPRVASISSSDFGRLMELSLVIFGSDGHAKKKYELAGSLAIETKACPAPWRDD